MRIQFGNVVLNDDISRSRMLSNLRIGGAPFIQEADLVRSAYARTFDRGNRRTTVTFSIYALFSTLAAAETYPATHLAQLPNKAELKLTTSGPTVSALYLWEAALAKLPEFTPYGLTVMINYAFIGGALMTTLQPTS